MYVLQTLTSAPPTKLNAQAPLGPLGALTLMGATPATAPMATSFNATDTHVRVGSLHVVVYIINIDNISHIMCHIHYMR